MTVSMPLSWARSSTQTKAKQISKIISVGWSVRCIQHIFTQFVLIEPITLPKAQLHSKGAALISYTASLKKRVMYTDLYWCNSNLYSRSAGWNFAVSSPLSDTETERPSRKWRWKFATQCRPASLLICSCFLQVKDLWLTSRMLSGSLICLRNMEDTKLGN